MGSEAPILTNKAISAGEALSGGHQREYRCHIAVLSDDDGRFSVLVMNLPGAGSCGDSKQEAIANVREAVIGVIDSYIKDGLDIPWLDPSRYSVPEGAEQEWILVNA